MDIVFELVCSNPVAQPAVSGLTGNLDNGDPADALAIRASLQQPSSQIMVSDSDDIALAKHFQKFEGKTLVASQNRGPCIFSLFEGSSGSSVFSDLLRLYELVL